MKTCPSCGQHAADAAKFCSRCGSPMRIPAQVAPLPKQQQISAWAETLFLVKDDWKMTGWDSVVQENYVRVGSLVSVREFSYVHELIDLVNSMGDSVPRAVRPGDVFCLYNKHNGRSTAHLVLDQKWLTDQSMNLGKINVQVSALSKLHLCRMPKTFHSFIR